MLLSHSTNVVTGTKVRSQIREIARSSAPHASRPSAFVNAATPLAIPAVRPAQRAVRPSSATATSSGVPTADTSRGAKVIDNVYDVVVVGGGLSGLVTGLGLEAQHGVKNFLVTEARERVGGNITSMSGDGYVWEEGPNSFQPNDSMLQVAVRSAALGSQHWRLGSKGKFWGGSTQRARREDSAGKMAW
jgi:oxygen-dependent protoporphyrinogen oxidase